MNTINHPTYANPATGCASAQYRTDWDFIEILFEANAYNI